MRLFCFILIIFNFSSFWSSTPKISQLKSGLDDLSPKTKLKRFYDISHEYLDLDPDSTLIYTDRGIELAKNINVRYDQIRFNLIRGLAFKRLGEINLADSAFHKALKLALEINVVSLAQESYFQLGILNVENYHQYDLARDYYQKALKIALREDDKIETSRLYNHLGINYENLNDYGKALEYYLLALEVNQKIPDSLGVANSLNNIGNIYHNLNNIDKALQYYLESTNIERKLDNELGLASSYNNLGNVYSYKHDYDLANSYYNKALKIARKYDNKELIGTTLNNLAIAFYENNDFSTALDYYLESMEISIETNDKWGMSNTNNNLAELYYYLEDYDKANYYVWEGLRLAKELNAQDLMIESYNILARLKFYDKDYKNAYDYFTKYSALKDSLYAESIFQINSLHSQFETEKKEKEIELLLEEQKHNRFVRNILVAMFLFVLMIIAFLYYLNQSKKKEIQIRELTEKRLQESESKFRTLAENIKTVIYTIDETGSFTYTNPMGELITGYKLDELKNMKFYDIVHPDFREEAKSKGFSRLKGKVPTPNYSLKIITKQKQEKWIDVSNGILLLNGKPFILGSATDITERKRTEEKLLESEERYRTLQSNVPVCIFRITLEGKILSVNQYMVKMFGYNSIEEMQKLPAVKIYKNPLDRKRMIEMIEKEGYIIDYEVELVRKNGSVLWGSLNSRIIKDENGKSIYQDGIIRDITEKKKAQFIQDVIYNVSTAINKTEELDDLFKIIHNELAKIIVVRNFYIALYDKKTNIITAPYYIDKFKKVVPKPQQLKNGITAYVIRKGKSLFLTPEIRNELVEAGEIADVEWKSKIWLGVPLMIGKKVIGAMAVQSYEDNNLYSENDQTILEIVSDQIALAVNKKRADSSIRDSERFSRAIIDSSPLGISARDQNGALLIANEAWRKIWGLSEDEIINDFRSRKKLTFDERDDYLDKYKDEVKNIYLKGGELYIPELKLLGKKKITQSTWISQYFYAIKDENDKVDKVVIITEDITTRKQNEMVIQSSLREKDVMLKEIYHRVKNNMQVISSLLKLQSNHVKDQSTLELFKESQNRVRSMSLIHEKLYLSENLEKINFDNYIRSLGTYLFSSYSVNPYDVKLNVNASNVFLDINKAIPLGLMVNELVSNALKHAFKEGNSGEVDIRLERTRNNFILTIANDGRKFPDKIDLEQTKSLGLQLVKALAEQLHGKVILKRFPRTIFTIKFPIEIKKE